MALQDQPFSVSYGQGVDSKTDAKQVAIGKLLRLENAVFTAAKRINKRNGNDVLPSASINNPTSAVAASQTISGILYTAKEAGFNGNGITINLIAGGTAGSELVTVSGPAVTIQIQVGVSTRAQVVAAINSDTSLAKFIISASVTTPGTALVTGNAVPLIGGVSAGIAGTTITEPKLIKSFKGELVAVSKARLYSYSPTEALWIDKGSASQMEVTSQFVSQTSAGQFDPSAARLNNIQLMSWDAQGVITATAWDMDTDTSLMPETALRAAGSGNANFSVPFHPKSIALGSSALGVVWNDNAQIILRILDLSGSSATFGAPISLASDVGPGAAGLAPSTFYVTSTSTGAVIAYSAGPGGGAAATKITVKTINTSGSVTNTASINSPYVEAPTIGVGSNGDIWVYWADNTSAGVAKETFYAVFDSALSPILSKTSIFKGPGTIAMAALAVSTSSQTLAYNYYDTFSGGTGTKVVYQVSVTNAGVIGAYRFLAWDCFIISEYITVAGVNYILLGALGVSATDVLNNPQQSYFLVDAGTGSVASRAFYGSAGRGGAYAPNISLPLITPPVIVGSKISFAVGQVSAGISGTLYKQAIGVRLLTFDFSSTEVDQALVINTMISNGGLLKSYDGYSNVEVGFNQFPSITAVAGSGSLSAGTYQVSAVYEWLDLNGDLYQSAPSIPASVVVGAAGSVIVSVNNLSLTDKQFPRNNITIALYMTDANGTVLKRVSATTSTYNNPLGGVASFTISSPPTSAAAFMYTTGGVIENIPPPPSVAMVAHNNRIFCVDSTDKNTIWYSKSISPGTPVSFSDLLISQIGQAGGEINALASMDDKLVILEEKFPLIMSGDGANDLGTNSTFSFPVPIPSDVGASNSKSVLVSPLGVHFKTSKGLYLLDRSTTVKYWGADVEQYNSQDITSALIMPGTTQMRFLTSSGLTLVYDYFFGQWSTFTNFQGYGADIWQGKYVYARTDGAVYSENFTSFLDNTTAYAVKAQFGWLKGAVIQGFQRLKQFLQLGEYTNGSSASHGVQVSLAYDYLTNPSLPSFSTPVPYYFGAASSTGSFQFRQFPEEQKCESASLLIEELPTGVSGESFNLTDMTVVAGVKKGAFKLPSAQSVG